MSFFGVADCLKVPNRIFTVNTQLGLHSNISYQNAVCMSLRPNIHVKCYSIHHIQLKTLQLVVFWSIVGSITLSCHIDIEPTVDIQMTTPCSQQKWTLKGRSDRERFAGHKALWAFKTQGTPENSNAQNCHCPEVNNREKAFLTIKKTNTFCLIDREVCFSHLYSSLCSC